MAHLQSVGVNSESLELRELDSSVEVGKVATRLEECSSLLLARLELEAGCAQTIVTLRDGLEAIWAGRGGIVAVWGNLKNVKKCDSGVDHCKDLGVVAVSELNPVNREISSIVGVLLSELGPKESSRREVAWNVHHKLPEGSIASVVGRVDSFVIRHHNVQLIRMM